MAPRVDSASAPPLRRRDVIAFGAGLALAPTLGWAKSTGSRDGELAVAFCGEVAESDSAVSVVNACVPGKVARDSINCGPSVMLTSNRWIFLYMAWMDPSRFR